MSQKGLSMVSSCLLSNRSCKVFDKKDAHWTREEANRKPWPWFCQLLRVVGACTSCWTPNFQIGCSNLQVTAEEQCPACGRKEEEGPVQILTVPVVSCLTLALTEPLCASVSTSVKWGSGAGEHVRGVCSSSWFPASSG